MNSDKLKVFGFCFSFCLVLSYVIAQFDNCAQNQQCTLLDHCPPLHSLSLKQTLSTEETRLLLRSQCGYEGRQPKVCCNITQMSCETPNSLIGRCIPIKSCSPLVKIISSKPISPENLKFLKDSQCGYENTQPLVCCPTEGSVASAVSIRQDGYTPNSPLLPSYQNCGNGPLVSKIIGGEATELDDFPWMALLIYEKNSVKRFGCGGSLINTRYVVTAAHCVKGQVSIDLGKLIIARLGEYDTKNETDCLPHQGCALPPQNIPVEQTIPHPSWQNDDVNQENDIALVRLAQEATYTAYVKPICLPNKVEKLNEIGLFVCGWGVTERNVRSNVKLKLKIPSLQLSACQNEYEKMTSLIYLNDRTQFCAGGEAGKDTCQGDSGGPAMSFYNDRESLSREFVWFLTGVTSFGPNPCGQPGIPGVYTKVNAFIDWILSNLRK